MMKKIKVMSIFGTRPEAIKMAPLINKLGEEKKVESIVVVTAQHREMLDQIVDLFAIKVDYDLDIMTPGQSLSDISAKILIDLEQVLITEKPDLILVHGDTTTSFIAALAAFYHKIKIAHIEAGLRSYNKYSPYPEEINRSLTGVLADIHFTPTINNKENLLTENISEGDIFVTGNTVIDALLEVIEEDYSFEEDILNRIDFKNKKIILLTAHRRENLGEKMAEIFSAIKELVFENSSIEVVFPVHLNPKVRKLAQKILGDLKGVYLIDPLNYGDFVNLMARVYLIMTDSGGIQEEAPTLGKPVLVLREVTERLEALVAGTIKLVGTDKEKIISAVSKLIIDSAEYNRMINKNNPYGDGKASLRICDYILHCYRLKNVKKEEFSYN
nr:UDP-N-acetylglucosamine 2-epimerase (non-hydrolyzing) [Orenia marismortui]